MKPRPVKLKKVRLIPKKVIEASIEDVDGEDDIHPHLNMNDRKQVQQLQQKLNCLVS